MKIPVKLQPRSAGRADEPPRSQRTFSGIEMLGPGDLPLPAEPRSEVRVTRFHPGAFLEGLLPPDYYLG